MEIQVRSGFQPKELKQWFSTFFEPGPTFVFKKILGVTRTTTCHRGGSRGGGWGDRHPKTCESIFFHNEFV